MKGKTIIITGASSGIGKALALRFAADSCRLVITGRNRERLLQVANQVEAAGSECLPLVSDVEKPEECANVITETLRLFGSIHVLINNAGISMRGLLTETKPEVLEKVMAVNFWGTVHMSRMALPYLLQTGGSIVAVSSIAGKRGLPGRCAYSASKFAVEGFMQSIRTENLRKGLHVLVACPGFTASGIRNTALGPGGEMQGESPRDESKMMTAEAVADSIFHAIRKRKNSLVLTFNGKLTVLLSKFFPSLADHLIYKHMSKEPGSPFS